MCFYVCTMVWIFSLSIHIIFTIVLVPVSFHLFSFLYVLKKNFHHSIHVWLRKYLYIFFIQNSRLCRAPLIPLEYFWINWLLGVTIPVVTDMRPYKMWYFQHWLDDVRDTLLTGDPQLSIYSKISWRNYRRMAQCSFLKQNKKRCSSIVWFSEPRIQVCTTTDMFGDLIYPL